MATISYGTFTITNELDGSQFWTTTVAPISPDYTFTVSNLFGDTNADIKVGDVILFSHYRYTVTSVNNDGTTVVGGNRESLRGVDGISPTVKSIVCSHAAVVCEKDGAYNPDTIKFSGQAIFENNINDYQGWFVIELSSDSETWVSNYTSASKESFVNYKIPLGLNITKDGILYYQGSATTTNGSIVDSNFTISSDGIITTTQDIGYIIRSIRCSLYSDSNKTDLVDQQRINIAFDGVDGDKGDDGYTVVLSNENHTFAGNTTSAVDGGFTECDVIGLKGGIPIPCHIGTISGCPTGMTATVLINDSNNAKFRVTVTSSMVSQNGVLNVPVTVDGKLFNMKFTYSLKLNGLDAIGLGWMVNYSAPTVPNDGECIYYGFDESTKEPSFNTDGWVLWNGQEITIPHGCYVNPDDTMPYNTTIYSVYRLPTSTTYTGGTFHDVAWVASTNTWKSNTYNGTTATADVGTWTWDEDRDIILAMYVEPSNDGTITNAQLFTPPKKFSELVEPAKEMAKEAEKVAYHYLKVDTTGAMVANMTDDNDNEYTPSNIPTGKRNILITADDLRIRDGQTDLATYGDTITLGKSNGKKVIINTSGVNIYDNSNSLASFGSTVRVGQLASPHIILDSNSFNAYSANDTSYFSLSDGSTNATESYTVSEKLAVFTTTYPINTVTSVTVGGTAISSDKYEYSSGDDEFSLLEVPSKNSSIAITYTYSTEDEVSTSTTDSFTVGAISLTIPLTKSNISIVSVVVHNGSTDENVTDDCDYNSSTNSIVFTNDTYVPPVGSIVDVNYTINNTSPYFTFGTRNNSYAKGVGSASFANNGVASGANSFTTGDSNRSTGTASFTTGTGNVASGIYSFAEGRNNQASGSYAHAEGYGNIVNNIYGHAEGYGNTVSGTFSHAEGRGNKSTGTYSHSEGYNNTASGSYSHAGGTGSVASGLTSFAHGEGLQASMANAGAFGRYNEPLGFLFTVGNGTSNSARSNAFAVGQGGNCYIGKSMRSGTLSNSRRMFRTKEWSWDNLSINANSTLGTHTSSIAYDNYTPIAVSFIQIMNATNSGANAPDCNCYVCRFADTNRNMLAFNIKNMGDSAAKVKVVVEILYMATAAFT